MKILVTGSAGHLGEALMRTLETSDHVAIGLDIKNSPFTHRVGSITERSFVKQCMQSIDVVLHVATLHKPHVASHTRQNFVDINITGTLNLLEEAVSAGVKAFVYTSTTSVFGHVLALPSGAPAAWITEEIVPVPKNIYGVTKLAAENLCELFRRKSGLPCIILRTSRFFPEEDDDRAKRRAYDDANLKVNELLYRRADIEDVVSAHLLAMPFIDRVYVNELARTRLGWQPRYDFDCAIGRLRDSDDFRSDLARTVGSKGYHTEAFSEGPYPV